MFLDGEAVGHACDIVADHPRAPGLVAVSARVGAFALAANSKDAALFVELPAGGYTVQVSGADGGTGLALVEVYEVP